MNQPPLLLLDEPTASLDLPGRETVIGALERLAADEPGLATVTVVHHVEDIPACATHALLMREGASVAQGPIADGADPGDAERRLRAPDRAAPPGAAARGDRQTADGVQRYFFLATFASVAAVVTVSVFLPSVQISATVSLPVVFLSFSVVVLALIEPLVRIFLPLRSWMLLLSLTFEVTRTLFFGSH